MRLLAGLAVSVVLLISCGKKSSQSCAPATPASEASSMQAFCSDNNIDYTIDSNGIYYQIVDPGSGEMVNDNSLITVTYTSQFLDGTILAEQTQPAQDYLKVFIEGWRIAVPYIRKGGHIKMVIPSSLCYGCTGCCSMQPNLIAPNTPLYYDLVLLDVVN